MNRRILELALEALTRQKAAIEEEVESLTRQFERGRAVRPAATSHHMQSAAARRAQSAKMKAYWAKRKAEEVQAGGRKRKRR